jgi:hypothetical protein
MKAILATWVIAIFIWIYLLPILLVGFIMCIPFFIVVTPLLMTISITIIYMMKDEIIPQGLLRDYINNVPYKEWFGQIDYIPSYPNPALICSHPHGIICTGILFSTHFKPGSTTLFAVSKWLFTVPFVGWLARHLGCIPATYESITKALLTNTVILVPGGVPELVSGTMYTRRHGFLKIAKQSDVYIIPVYTDTTFYNRLSSPLDSLCMYIAKTIDLPIMLPVIGYYGSWLPKRKPIKMSIKEPFKVQGNIEQERVRYFKALNQI